MVANRLVSVEAGADGAHGDFRVKVSAPSAPASTETRRLATTAQISLTSGQRVDAASSYVKITSSVVSGDPSWKVSPLRRLTRHLVPPAALDASPSASTGVGAKVASARYRPAWTMEPTSADASSV